MLTPCKDAVPDFPHHCGPFAEGGCGDGQKVFCGTGYPGAEFYEKKERLES